MPSVFRCNVSDGAVLAAVGFAVQCGRAAEMKARLAGLASGPAAHAGAQRRQPENVNGFGFRLRRGAPLRQAQSMDLADHRVLCNSKAAAYLAGGQFFFPVYDKSGGSFGCPIGGHYILPGTKISRVEP